MSSGIYRLKELRPPRRPRFPRGRVIGSPHRSGFHPSFGGRSGRPEFPPCQKPGATPRQQPMCPWDKEFKLIESASRPVGEKRGYPTFRGLSFRCLIRRRHLSRPQSRTPYISPFCVSLLPSSRAFGTTRRGASWVRLDYHYSALSCLPLYPLEQAAVGQSHHLNLVCLWQLPYCLF